MHYRQIVILVTCCLVAFGIYSLPQMQKNEFPDFTIRQGMVIAVAPGNTVNEMVEQVTKPLEDYIFSYKEVKKEKTFSTTRDGIVFVQVELNDELNNKDEFWSKFKHGVATFKSQLPPNVLAIQVMDDFGDTSALLITMESKDKTYRELSDYMDELKNRLRRISSVGRLTVSGERAEQISIYLDPERLSHYGLNEQLIAGQLFAKGFVTTGGRIQTPQYVLPVHVEKTFNTLYDVQQQIVYSDPSGNVVRLQDVARVVKEYPHADSYIKNNGTKCILLSVEMKKGKNIVQMGNDIDRVLEIVHLQADRKRKVGQYSLGMKQRLGIAMALLGSPRLLILDEPTNGLDPAGIQEMRALIHDMPDACGATVLISSHLLGEMEQIVSQVGIINHGQLLFEGPLTELQRHSRGNVVLRLLAPDRGAAVLRRYGLTPQPADNGCLLPTMEDARLAALVQDLAAEGAGVVGVERQTKNLEEIFLSLTNTQTGKEVG